MTDAIVLTDFRIKLDRIKLKEELRIVNRATLCEDFDRLVTQVRTHLVPKAVILPTDFNQKNDKTILVGDVAFTSRLLAINLENSDRLFSVVATAGKEFDTLIHESKDMLRQYWLDQIGDAILDGIINKVQREIKERFKIKNLSWMMPGSLEDWPISEQRPLFKLVGDYAARIGVLLSKDMLMTPLKTLSGIWFESESVFFSCKLCLRDGCHKRRAAYDQQLAEERFQLKKEQCSGTVCG